MADESVKIQVELELLQSKLKDIENKIEESGEKAGSKFISGFEKRLIAVGASALAFLFSKESINAALESEKAVTSFNRALARTGELSSEASSSFQKFASDLQASTGLADEAILDVATKIQNLGTLSVPQLRRATQATLDFATALGVDLESAATLVGKAATGNVAAFGKLGLEIQKGKTDAETFANTLDALEKRFGGSSAAAIGTFGGAVRSVSVAFSDIQEELGKLTTNSPVLTAVIGEIGKILNGVAKNIESFGKSGDRIGDLTKRFLELGQAINFYVIRPFEVLFNVANVVFQAILVWQQALIAGFAKVASGIVSLGNKVGVFSDDTKATMSNLSESTSSVLGDFTGKLKDAFSNVGSQEFSNKIQTVISDLQFAADNAKPLGDKFAAGVGDGFKQVETKASELQTSIEKIVKNGIVQVISTGFQSVGAALVRGASAFDDFKKAIFNIVGDILINVGTAIIATSQAVEALKATLTTLFGGFGIAAGLALIALGGALKAIGGGGLAGAATGGGGGSTGSTAPVAEQPDPEQIVGSQSRVTVNIQGDVLDTRDTGLRIVELIQEAFDTNGAVASVGRA